MMKFLLSIIRINSLLPHIYIRVSWEIGDANHTIELFWFGGYEL